MIKTTAKTVIQQTMMHSVICKVTFLLSFVFLGRAVSAQTITQHRFSFKGFSIILNDDASDENSNHLLVGEIQAIETEEENRDSMINKIFDLKGYCNDDRMGILIATDKDYNILEITQSCRGEKVVYDRTSKQFTIGGNVQSYLQVGSHSFSAWQPVIVQVDLALKGKAYFVQKPYSCILKDIAVEKDEVLIFTRSNFNQTNERKFNEKAEIIGVTTSRFHTDSTRPWIQVLEPLWSIQTPYEDVGRITLSAISKGNDTYYFTTSNLNQFDLKNVHHLYQLKNNELTEVPGFSDYMKGTIRTSDSMKYLEWETESYDWININGFTVNSTKSYSLLTHAGATKKEMVFSKTDTRFNTLLSHKISLNDYADFNKMLVLSNGNMLILAVNAKETWSYLLYDSTMQFIREIQSTLSKKYCPTNLKDLAGNRIECLFYTDKENEKANVLETVQLDGN